MTCAEWRPINRSAAAAWVPKFIQRHAQTTISPFAIRCLIKRSSFLSRQQRQGFNMKSVGKKIDWLHDAQFISLLCERGKIAGESCRIARDVSDHIRAQGSQVRAKPFRSRSGRIEHDLGKFAPLSQKLLECSRHVSDDPVDGFDTVMLSVELSVGNRWPVSFDGSDPLDAPSQRQGEVAGARVELEDPITIVKIAQI